jgi:hypothetical protein
VFTAHSLFDKKITANSVPIKNKRQKAQSALFTAQKMNTYSILQRPAYSPLYQISPKDRKTPS